MPKGTKYATRRPEYATIHEVHERYPHMSGALTGLSRPTPSPAAWSSTWPTSTGYVESTRIEAVS